jgi:nucleoside-diphosphate-sugar epimerase
VTNRVVVTGSAGFIGRRVVARFRVAGYTVLGVVRPGTLVGPEEPGVTRVERDLTAPDSLADVLQPGDLLIHLAARAHRVREDAADPLAAFRAANVEPVRTIARSASAARIARFVFLSSAKVFGEGRESPYTLHDPPSPVDAYGRSKWEAEQVLRACAASGTFTWTTLRPPFVYGPGGKGNFPRLMLLALVATRLPLPLASISNRRSMIFVDNLADAIYHCATNQAAANRTYLPTDGHDVSTPELLETIAAVQGSRSRLFPAPVWLLRTAARLVARSAEMERLTESLRLDPTALHEELGWHPPFALEDGIAMSVGAQAVSRPARDG